MQHNSKVTKCMNTTWSVIVDIYVYALQSYEGPCIGRLVNGHKQLVYLIENFMSRNGGVQATTADLHVGCFQFFFPLREQVLIVLYSCHCVCIHVQLS